MANPKTMMSSVWKTATAGTQRHIQVFPFRGGWLVGEADLDNSQFFSLRSDAEAAARTLGERLSDAGDHGEITVRLPNGVSGGSFIISQSDHSEPRRS